MDLVIKGGTVISPWGRQKLDIMVDKGKIVALGDVGAAKADRVIDATGKMVIPGGIECHTHHENAFQGAVGGDDFYGGSVAAACGGTTTMMDFSITLKGNMPLDFLKKRISMAEERGIVLDFSFHCCLTEINPEILAQIKDVIDYGAASFKVYMIYRKEEMMLDDGQLMALMDVATKHGGLVGVHAENAAIAEYRTDLLLKNGRTRWTDHPVAKPNIVEAEAIQRAALLAKEMGTGMYIYHMSTKEGVDICRNAHLNNQPLYAETCPHYLTFTEDVYNREDGYLYLISPPLRKQADIDALWKGMADKAVKVTSTDHAPFTLKEKQMNMKWDDQGNIIQEYHTVANGGPGIEMKLPTLINGVSNGKLTWEQLVFANSYGAARIFGFYPQKGLIEVGADADIVIVDPEKEVNLTNSMLHMNVEYTLYEGLHYKGWPVMTISRGTVLMENGEFVGPKGHGKYIKRSIDPEILKSSAWM
jgi:dihydropyrimidinase